MGCKIRMTGLFSLAALAIILNGCAPFPTRGPWQYVTDTRLNREVKKAVATAVPGENKENLKITTFDYYVRFSGWFSTEARRQAAVAAARKVPMVRDVLDYTVVGHKLTNGPPVQLAPQVTLSESRQAN